MTPREQIHTERLTIRRFTEMDAQDLYEYLSDLKIYKYEPGEPITLEQAFEHARMMANNQDFWAIAIKSEHKVIGQLYFSQQEPSHLMTWELGYIMNMKYQQQGYTSEAAAALLQYGFEQLSVHRVVSHCNPQNVASWKLLEKIGFHREGLLRKNIYFRKDEAGNPLWWDSYAYARLEDRNEFYLGEEK